MAKKQARSRKRGSAVRGKSRKTSRSAGGKAAKRSATKPMPKKRLAKAKPKPASGKKALQKNMRTPQSKGVPVQETTIVDVIEEPAPGVITITEFEETHVRKGSVDRAEPEED